MTQIYDNPFSYWIKDASFDFWMEECGMLPSESSVPEMAWADLETTGIDATREVTLQVGIILTDRVGRVIRNGAADWLVYDNEHDAFGKSWPNAIVGMDKFVEDMHRQGGLLKDIANAVKHPEAHRMHPAEVAVNVSNWLDFMGVGHKDLPMSGSNPQFDRKFLLVDLPLLDDWFHYRNGADVSGLRELAKRTNKGLIEVQPKKAEKHRPIPDLCDSIKLYRFLLENFLVMDDETKAMF